MRLKQRSSVLLPQPDGPMMAVTWLAPMSQVTPATALAAP